MNFSNGPEEEGVQEEDDGAELPPWDLDLVFQCGASSYEVSDSRPSQTSEPEEPMSLKTLGTGIWACEVSD